MQERKGKEGAVSIILLVLAVLGTIGFEISVWNTVTMSGLTRVAAMLVGFFVYLYAVTFTLGGIIFIIKLRAEEDTSELELPFKMFGYAMIDLSISMQLIFWGILKENTACIVIGSILAALFIGNVIMGWIPYIRTLNK